MRRLWPVCCARCRGAERSGRGQPRGAVAVGAHRPRHARRRHRQRRRDQRARRDRRLEQDRDGRHAPVRVAIREDDRSRHAGRPGGTGGAAAINERGQIVGYSSTATDAVHAFMWQSGKMTDLGTLGAG